AMSPALKTGTRTKPCVAMSCVIWRAARVGSSFGKARQQLLTALGVRLLVATLIRRVGRALATEQGLADFCFGRRRRHGAQVLSFFAPAGSNSHERIKNPGLRRGC